MKAEKHIGDTVKIIFFNSKTGNIDKRVGIIEAVTLGKIIFLLLDEDQDLEIVIPIKDIKQICNPDKLI